ncbi:hypothetical protein [Streptomyces mirabilis]|uniref:hypothetical protein n=1 Tax=Streptomyces mirabilis TaxID=68239 RepID=UPI0036677F0E
MFAVSSKVVVLRTLLFWLFCEAFFALTTPLLVGWMGTPEKGYGELLHEYLRGPEMYLVAAALCAARLPSLSLQAYRRTGTATPWVYLALILGANASLVMAAAASRPEHAQLKPWVTAAVLGFALLAAAAALVFAEYEPEPGSGRVPASHAPNISASSSSVAHRRWRAVCAFLVLLAVWRRL